MVAVYLGEPCEERILGMSYAFFNRVLRQLNRRLRYDAAVGYAGNSFFKDSAELIEKSNPLHQGAEQRASYGAQMAAMLNTGAFEVMSGSTEQKNGVANEYGLTFD